MMVQVIIHKNIAEKFEQQYPGIVRAILKKIKGMVVLSIQACNTQLGNILKVVDSDDWVDVRAYLKI